jgi:hypothetical protein
VGAVVEDADTLLDAFLFAIWSKAAKFSRVSLACFRSCLLIWLLLPACCAREISVESASSSATVLICSTPAVARLWALGCCISLIFLGPSAIESVCEDITLFAYLSDRFFDVFNYTLLPGIPSGS